MESGHPITLLIGKDIDQEIFCCSSNESSLYSVRAYLSSTTRGFTVSPSQHGINSNIINCNKLRSRNNCFHVSGGNVVGKELFPGIDFKRVKVFCK